MSSPFTDANVTLLLFVTPLDRESCHQPLAFGLIFFLLAWLVGTIMATYRERLKSLHTEVWQQGKPFIRNFEGVTILDDALAKLSNHKFVFVRDEYARVWDHVLSLRNKAVAARDMGQDGLVVTGHHGIGNVAIYLLQVSRHPLLILSPNLQENRSSSTTPSVPPSRPTSQPSSVSASRGATSLTKRGSRSVCSPAEIRSTLRRMPCTWSTATPTSTRPRVSSWIRAESSSRPCPLLTGRGGLGRTAGRSALDFGLWTCGRARRCRHCSEQYCMPS